MRLGQMAVNGIGVHHDYDVDNINQMALSQPIIKPVLKDSGHIVALTKPMIAPLIRLAIKRQ